MDRFLKLFYILCLGITIGTIIFIVYYCSGNTELMYIGLLTNNS